MFRYPWKKCVAVLADNFQTCQWISFYHKRVALFEAIACAGLIPIASPLKPNLRLKKYPLNRYLNNLHEFAYLDWISAWACVPVLVVDEKWNKKHIHTNKQIAGRNYLPGAQLWSKNLLTLYSSPRQSGVIVRVARRSPMGMFQPWVELKSPWQLLLPLRSAIELILALLLMITTAL